VICVKQNPMIMHFAAMISDHWERGEGGGREGREKEEKGKRCPCAHYQSL